MGRKRKANRVVGTAQRGFHFPAEAKAPTPASEVVGDDRFLADDPREIFLANEKLGSYLARNGQGWVLRLRSALEQLEYWLLTQSYSSVGRKAIHPRVMLGLIVYGMLQRQWSLRELQSLAQRDLGAWWICGGQQPDHSTIGKFIVLHSEILSEEFFVELLGFVIKKLGLKPGTVAGDGTVVEAAGANLRRLKAEAAMQWAQQREGEAEAVQAVVQAIEHRLEDRKVHRRGDGELSLCISEPQAVVQPCKDGRQRACYKPSIWVHESGFIVGQHVHPSSETAALEPLGTQHQRLFGSMPETALLDAGYFSIAVLEQFTDAGVDVLCPSGKVITGQWTKAGAGQHFAKDRFRYDEPADVYHCPAGQILKPLRAATDAKGRRFREYKAVGVCASCTVRTQCTKSRSGRTIKRYAGEQFKEAMLAVLEQPRARQKYRQRSALAERPFAEIKDRQGLRRFHRRGLLGVRVEFALHCMAFDLKKMILGMPFQALFAVITGNFDQSSARVSFAVVMVLIKPRY
jgi:transposase